MNRKALAGAMLLVLGVVMTGCGSSETAEAKPDTNVAGMSIKNASASGAGGAPTAPPPTAQ